jgi:hypothetical protein
MPLFAPKLKCTHPSGFGNPKGLDVLAQDQREVELV